MDDIERLKQWMEARNVTLYGLAQEINIPYNTLWRMVIDRKALTDGFIVQFIRVFGCDVATKVFVNHLTLSTS